MKKQTKIKGLITFQDKKQIDWKELKDKVKKSKGGKK